MNKQEIQPSFKLEGRECLYLKEQLYQKAGTQLIVRDGVGSVRVAIEPSESFILSF